MLAIQVDQYSVSLHQYNAARDEGASRGRDAWLGIAPPPPPPPSSSLTENYGKSQRHKTQQIVGHARLGCW